MNAVPINEWNGLARAVKLPNNVNASHLRHYVNSMMDMLNSIKAEYRKEYDGNNYIGKLSEKGEAILENLQNTIDDHVSTIEDGGLIRVEDYLMGNNLKIDGDITHQAKEIMLDTSIDNFVIIGGLDAVIDYLNEYREAQFEKMNDWFEDTDLLLLVDKTDSTEDLERYITLNQDKIPFTRDHIMAYLKRYQQTL